MTSKVAVVEFDGDEAGSFKQALNLIGGIDDLNTSGRTVVVKVGVFSHKAQNHTSVSVVRAIVDGFNRAQKILIAESDNYQGPALVRLQIWKELFNERVVPVSLSDEANARTVRLADQEMKLSSMLFKPNVLVDTHILRTFEKGSILKNLFGCIPTPKKAKFHKADIFSPLLADVFEAVGGIDLAVLDGSHLWRGAGTLGRRMNTLVVGRDAVAVETVGATVVGLKPEKMPVIREFVKRGLGEGDIQSIEVLGASLESLREKFTTVSKSPRKKRKADTSAPQV